jgi:hypothetical protein
MTSALAVVGVGLVTLFSASDQNVARVTTGRCRSASRWC